MWRTPIQVLCKCWALCGGQTHSAWVAALTFAVPSESLKTVAAACWVAGATRCWSDALLPQAQEVHEGMFSTPERTGPPAAPVSLPYSSAGRSPLPHGGEGGRQGCRLLPQEPPATFRSGKAPASLRFSFLFFFVSFFLKERVVCAKSCFF